MDEKLTEKDFARYQRQLALPEITPEIQKRLKATRILVIGAGGLGAPSLPYLAGAGIGHITIIDDDNVDLANLHRQTIFRESDAGNSKAQLAAQYLQNLNPDIDIRAIAGRISAGTKVENFDLIIDGSDNFKTKTLLNEISIAQKIPLISASVLRFESYAGIFAGFAGDAPCYTCLFPELPENACNCNEAGVLGTAAGLAGIYEAHLALCFLAGIGDIGPGTVLNMDFKALRVQRLNLKKDPSCRSCGTQRHELKKPAVKSNVIPLVLPKDLTDDFVILDVREDHEVEFDPIPGAIHIPLMQIPMRVDEIPRDKTLALACQANIRSRMGAQMLREFGFENVCVLDRLAA